METLEPTLAAHPFLRDMQPSQIQLITGCAANVRFDAGEYLFREGAEANHFWVIRHGQVAIQIFGAQRGALSIQTVGAGDILGWSWLVPPYRWHFSAQATELTRAIALDGKCLRMKCEEDHELGYELLKRFSTVMAERLDATRLQLLDVYADHPKGARPA
jgi:CRP/FNR family transcriptional regulator, cyclic AMP receptor protein